MARARLFAFKSVRTKLIVLFVLIGVVPASLVAAISFVRAKQALVAATSSRMQAIAEDMATILDNTFFERYGDVLVFAGSSDAAADPAKVTTVADFYTKQYLVYDLMVVADMNGKVIAVNSV